MLNEYPTNCRLLCVNTGYWLTFTITVYLDLSGLQDQNKYSRICRKHAIYWDYFHIVNLLVDRTMANVYVCHILSDSILQYDMKIAYYVILRQFKVYKMCEWW